MKRFTDPVRECVKNGIWMPALTTSLTLPDICAHLETPEVIQVGQRYRRWAKQWIEPLYTSPIGARKQEVIFLTSSDLYALRCAINHSGVEDIETQKARDVLRSFAFLAPKRNNIIHRNLFNDVLQLQVDIFCMELCDAVDKWDAGSTSNEGIQARKKQLITISESRPPFVVR